MDNNNAYQINILKTKDYDRFITSLFIGNDEKLNEVASLFCFNSELANISSATKEEMVGMIRFKWWSEAIEEIYLGHVRKHYLLPDIAKIITKYNIEQSLFIEMIDAREKDLSQLPFNTLAEYIEYLDKASGNLYRILAKITGSNNLDDYVNLGIFYNIIGHLRSFGFYLRDGIIIFPHDLIAEHKITEEDVFMGVGLKPYVKQFVDLAESYYQKIDLKALNKTFYLQAKLAWWYLRLIRKNNYNILRKEIGFGKLNKLLRLFIAAVIR